MKTLQSRMCNRKREGKFVSHRGLKTWEKSHSKAISVLSGRCSHYQRLTDKGVLDSYPYLLKCNTPAYELRPRKTQAVQFSNVKFPRDRVSDPVMLHRAQLFLWPSLSSTSGRNFLKIWTQTHFHQGSLVRRNPPLWCFLHGLKRNERNMYQLNTALTFLCLWYKSW